MTPETIKSLNDLPASLQEILVEAKVPKKKIIAAKGNVLELVVKIAQEKTEELSAQISRKLKILKELKAA